MIAPRTRKLIGSLLLLAFVFLYALLAMWLGATVITPQPKWVQLGYYLVAGIAWIFPAFVVIRWSLRPVV